MTATFDTEAQTVTVEDGSLPALVFTFGTDVTVRSGGYRTQVLRSGGGHWETSLPGSLPAEGTGFELDGAGHIKVTLE